MKKIIAGGHTLSAMFKVNNIRLLQNVMAAIVSRGGTLIEIPFILCSIGWDHVGSLAKKMGIKEIALCHFWVRDDGASLWGDPIGSEAEINRAISTWERIFDAVEILRKRGIAVRFIDGPTWGTLGYEYKEMPSVLIPTVIAGLKGQGDLCAKHDLILAPEQLRRDPEDKVTWGTLSMLQILKAVNRPNVKMHFDIFHSLENGEDPIEMLTQAKELIGYLHLHGPGRCAPGANGDTIDWEQAADAIHCIDSGIDEIPGLPEPFGKRTCEEAPELGKGLPPMGPLPKYFDRAFLTFKQVELLSN